MPLRRRLFLLSAAGILPLALMAGVGLDVLAGLQREQSRRVGLELARSVATAIETELRSTISALNAFATTPTLEEGDLAGFRRRAQRVLDSEQDWAAVALADRAATVLVDTREPAGGALQPLAERESFDQVVRTGAPVVGSLARSPGGEWLFAVRVPVRRSGEIRYVLTAFVKPEGIRAVLTRQRVPRDWVISIVDAHGLRVARSRAHEQNLGGRLSESVQAVVDGGGTEGFGLARTLEGEKIYTPYSRLIGGWNAVLGIPTADFEDALHGSLVVYGGGILLSIAVGLLAALWVAGSINRPMAGLRAAAEALGRREPPHVPETTIMEIRAVGAALVDAAREIDELLEKERRLREAAEAADRAKDEFLKVLSHELRTPLNAVYGWARMLQAGDGNHDPTTAKALDVIVRNADAQVRLIDDLLDVSRITTGKVQLDVRPVGLETVLREALDAVRPAADARGVHLAASLAGDVPPVAGDPARLQQVVWNLLMNGIKFTPRGGTVEIRLRRAGALAEVVVSDTGRGIAAEVLPHVFERFRQADSSSTRSHGGLGLGLTLVKHLVEMHGGSVVAESEGEGRGATFTVVLPIAADPMREPTLARARPSRAPLLPAPLTARLDGLRILVTDDEADAVQLLESVLGGAGAEVRSCLRADEALDQLRRWRPDVLVADIEMPGHDGYWLIGQVRGLAAGEGGHTPAIALTAYGRAEDRRLTLAAGFSMHVHKPVDPAELTTIIGSVVERLVPPGHP